MATSLSPYVPRLAVEWDLDARGTSWRRIDATCCFVDISGFTALSERLARRGRIGAEELTEVLDAVFSRMLDVAYDAGGSLLKFGGDALLLAFSSGDHAVYAARAAVAMRAALREARSMRTSVGHLNLRMSIGVHTGSFDFFRVGTEHRELLVTGPAATQTTLMEQTAVAGEIVISPATAERLPAGAVGDAKGDGRLLRWRKAVEVGVGATPIREVPASDIERCVPVALRRHLRDGGGESEHRIATVGFVKFQGVDDYLAANGADATVAALDEIVTTVQRAADDEEITFLASDIDANGGKIILAAGVPVARVDDEGRMLRAARTIVDKQSALPIRIGVNRGHVFVGEIGTEFRRTFTVMGDTVNLAARLMAAATPGRLYATAEVLERSRMLFTTETLEPFHVKGKAHPVQAYAVGEPRGARSAGVSSLPFVGREPELEALVGAYRVARDEGTGAVAVIEADRGSGKTRLLHELIERCDATVMLLQAEAYSAASPYLPWRAALRALLEIDADDPAKAAAQLEAAVRRIVPAASALAPLLASMLEVELEPTPESAAIAPEFRRDRLGDFVVQLLEGLPGPLLIAADDAQWLDEASAGLVERVVAAAPNHPWLIVVTRRRDTAGYRPAAPDITQTLPSLGDDATRALIDTVTAAAPLRPQEREQLVARAAGNPLFIDELLRVARTSGFDSLPETLDAVATHEIDALSAPARRIVRQASVLGRVFRTDLLLDVLGVSDIDPEVLQELSAYLVPGDDRFEFRHALLQEAAYESLPFRTRVELHRRAGDAILRHPGADTEADDALLSLHFFRAQDWGDAWKYARSAGLRAAASFAPAEAATHLERAITAARRLGDVTKEEVAELLMQLADAFTTLGLYDQSDDAYRRAAALLRGAPVEQARIFERRSYVRGECQGRLTLAIRHVRAGVALLDAPESSGPDADRARPQLLAREADLRYRQGRLRDAAALCRRSMADAERVGERRPLAVAMDVLDSCLVEMGRPDEATHLPLVLDLYEQLGDLLGVASTLGNLGGIAFFESRWIEAADYYTRAADAANRAGDLATAAIAHANLGELLLNQGHVAAAEALLVPAVRTLESFDYVVTQALIALHLARARVFLGDTEAGIEMMRVAVTTLDRAKVRLGSIEGRARIAEASVLAGAFDAAAAAIAEARELEVELGETPLTVLLDRVEVTLAVQSGDTAHAVSLLELAVPRARSQRANYDLLLLLILADRLGVTDYGDKVARDGIARDLAVVRVAALPGV